jgi:hypothetical protein
MLMQHPPHCTPFWVGRQKLISGAQALRVTSATSGLVGQQLLVAPAFLLEQLDALC